VRAGIFIQRPDQAKEHGAVSLFRFDGEQANFQRPRSLTLKDAWLAQALSDGKGRLVVGTDHAHHTAVAEHNQVSVLAVKLVDQDAVARVGMLRNLADEGTVIETMYLFKFLTRFRSFENVLANSQHSWTTSEGARPAKKASDQPAGA